jgi:hypothetical protein
MTVRDDGTEFATLGNPIGDGVKTINIDTLTTTRTLQEEPLKPEGARMVVGQNTVNNPDQHGYSHPDFFGLTMGSLSDRAGYSSVLGAFSNYEIISWNTFPSTTFPGKWTIFVMEQAVFAGSHVGQPGDEAYNFPGFSLFDTVTKTVKWELQNAFVFNGYSAGTATTKALISWTADNIPQAQGELVIGREYISYQRYPISTEFGVKQRRTTGNHRIAPAAEYGLRWDRPEDAPNAKNDDKPLAFTPR